MSTKRKSKLANGLDGIPADEVAAARAQDATVATILRRARTQPQESEVNPDSARQNADFMEKMRLGSARALARRIGNKELVSKEEFIAMLGGRRRWVNEALRAQRLFSLKAPSGLEYFPAFFADDRYDRRALCRVVHALEGLPDESKYFFFMRKSTRLQATALEALAQGRTMEVVACALGFTQQ
jgi:hypothetical protein